MSRVSQWLELMALRRFLSAQVSSNCRHLVFNCPLVLTSLSSLAGSSNWRLLTPKPGHKTQVPTEAERSGSGWDMGGEERVSFTDPRSRYSQWMEHPDCQGGPGMVSGVIALTGNFMSWDLLCCCQIERARYNKTWIMVIVGLSLINIDVEFIDQK